MIPSGRQLELSHGNQRAVVVEVGGGLRTYRVDGHAVVDGYAEHEQCNSGRGQVLLPWPNRLEDGSYEFDGRRHQLPLDETEHQNAIHGLVRWVSWSVGERDGDRVVLEHTLHPQPGYPFSLALTIEYALTDEGLRVTSSATNVGDRPCPYGSGQHPYVTLGAESVDTLELRAPGQTVLHVDDRGLPTGAVPVEGTEFDFREPKAIGETKLDNAFTDLERGDDGRARVELRDPDGGSALTFWQDESYGYLQLFTGDPLPSVGRRSLAVEPMTCAPNAFRTGDGLLVLEPGATATASWGIQA